MSHQSRIDAWIRDLKPQNSIQTDLVIYAVACSIKLDELREVEAANNAYHSRVAPERARFDRADSAIEVGTELMASSNARSSSKGLPNRDSYFADGSPPRSPNLLVELLEATGEGCRWLVDRWAELRKLLDEQETWAASDERKATRLLGRTPEMEDTADVRTLRLAFAAMWNQPSLLTGEMTEEEAGPPIPTLDQAREMLRELCERHINRLQARAVVRDKIHDDDPARHNFDPSPPGQEIRRQHAATFRAMMKTLDTLTEMQKRAAREEKARAKESAAEDVRRESAASETADQSSPREDRGLTPPARQEPPPADRSAPDCRETSDNPAAPNDYLANRWREEPRRSQRPASARGKSGRRGKSPQPPPLASALAGRGTPLNDEGAGTTNAVPQPIRDHVTPTSSG